MENPFDIIIDKLTRIETDISVLKKLNPCKVDDDPIDDIVNFDEALKILDIAKPTLYVLTSKRKIPFFKRDGSQKLYFSKKALLEYISQGKKITVSEATDQVNEYFIKNRKKTGYDK